MAKRATTRTITKDSAVRKPGISAEALPRNTLEQAVVPQKLREVYAGKAASWDELAGAMGRSPTANPFKYLMWSATAYGLIKPEGERRYSLSETGRKIVAETYTGEAGEAKVKAVMTPTVLSKFFTDYDGSPTPAPEHFSNVLESRFGIPRDHTAEAADLILANGRYAGILSERGDGQEPIVELNGVSVPISRGESEKDADGVVRPEIGNSAVNWEKTCFFITPIGDEGSEIRKHADLMLKHLLRPVFKELDFEVIRADEIARQGIITSQVLEHLAKAKICIADLSFGNPNAFYELGVRHSFMLSTIQIIQKGDKIPFDLSQGRTITVDTSDRYTVADRLESARRELSEHVSNALAEKQGAAEDNPVAVYLPGARVTLPK